MHITITNSSSIELSPDLVVELERLAIRALEQEDGPKSSKIDISFVDVEEIRRLNAEYRQIDEPTDVLSFALGDNLEGWEEEPDGSVLLGDIIIAPQIVAARLEKYGLEHESAMRLMVVHGVLHLLGYDHQTDAEAVEMEDLEEFILHNA